MTRIAFVTNACPPYRVRTFELLAEQYDIDFYFYSDGSESYWQSQLGTHTGNFKYEYLPAWRIGQTRITPQLFNKLYPHDYDLYLKCINGKFALPATYAVARTKRKPFMLWTGVWQRLNTRSHKLFFPATRYIYQQATSIVTYGSHVNDYLVSEGIAPEKIFASRHAVDNDKYNRQVSPDEIHQFRDSLGVADDAKIILYIGRLEEGKGVNYLIHAFAQMAQQNAVLVVVGVGADEQKLKRLAQTFQLEEKIRFVGHVAKEKTVTCFAAAWMTVVPSVTTPTFKEPWGLVVNEAFNQGTPVIASSAVGAAAGGLVQQGKTGFIVPERDAFALSAAMSTLLTNENLRMGMSANAREAIATWSNHEMLCGFVKAIDYAIATKLR